MLIHYNFYEQKSENKYIATTPPPSLLLSLYTYFHSPASQLVASSVVKPQYIATAPPLSLAVKPLFAK